MYSTVVVPIIHDESNSPERGPTLLAFQQFGTSRSLKKSFPPVRMYESGNNKNNEIVEVYKNKNEEL